MLPAPELPVAAVPARVPARVTADSRYVLWVNGVEVARGPVRGNPRRLHYDVVDLAPLLRRGRNAIAVLVRFYGDATPWWMPRRPTLRARRGRVPASRRGSRAVDAASSGRGARTTRCGVRAAWAAARRARHRAAPDRGARRAACCRRDWRDADFDDASVERARRARRARTSARAATTSRRAIRSARCCRARSRSSRRASCASACAARVAARRRRRCAERRSRSTRRRPMRARCARSSGRGAPRRCRSRSAATCGVVVRSTSARRCGHGRARGRRAGRARASTSPPPRRSTRAGELDRLAAAQRLPLRRARRRRPLRDLRPDRLPLLALAVRAAGPVALRSVARARAARSRAPAGPALRVQRSAPRRASGRSAAAPSTSARTTPTSTVRRASSAPGRATSVVHQMVDLATNPDWRLARWHVELAASPRPDGMLPMAVGGDIEHADATFIPDWALHWVHALHNLYRYTGDRETVARLLARSPSACCAGSSRSRATDGLLADVTGWVLIDWSAVSTRGHVRRAERALGARAARLRRDRGVARRRGPRALGARPLGARARRLRALLGPRRAASTSTTSLDGVRRSGR